MARMWMNLAVLGAVAGSAACGRVSSEGRHGRREISGAAGLGAGGQRAGGQEDVDTAGAQGEPPPQAGAGGEAPQGGVGGQVDVPLAGAGGAEGDPYADADPLLPCEDYGTEPEVSAPGVLLFGAPCGAVGTALAGPQRGFPRDNLYWTFELGKRSFLVTADPLSRPRLLVESESPISRLDVRGAIAYKVGDAWFAISLNEPEATPIELAGAPECVAVTSVRDFVFCRTSQGTILRWPVVGGPSKMIVSGLPPGGELVPGGEHRFYFCEDGYGLSVVGYDPDDVVDTYGRELTLPPGECRLYLWQGSWVYNGTPLVLAGDPNNLTSFDLSLGYRTIKTSGLGPVELLAPGAGKELLTARDREDGSATIESLAPQPQRVVRYESPAGVVGLTGGESLYGHYYWLDRKGRVFADAVNPFSSKPIGRGFVTTLDDSRLINSLTDEEYRLLNQELEATDKAPLLQTYCATHSVLAPDTPTTGSAEERLTACHAYEQSCFKAETMTYQSQTYNWVGMALWHAKDAGLTIRELTSCLMAAEPELTCEGLQGNEPDSAGEACRNLAQRAPEVFAAQRPLFALVEGEVAGEPVKTYARFSPHPQVSEKLAYIEGSGGTQRYICLDDYASPSDDTTWTASELSELECHSELPGLPVDLELVYLDEHIRPLQVRGTMDGQLVAGDWSDSSRWGLNSGDLQLTVGRDLVRFAVFGQSGGNKFTSSLRLIYKDGDETSVPSIACGSGGTEEVVKTQGQSDRRVLHIDELHPDTGCPGTPIQGSLKQTQVHAE